MGRDSGTRHLGLLAAGPEMFLGLQPRQAGKMTLLQTLLPTSVER